MNTDEFVTKETLLEFERLNLMIGFSTSDHWYSKVILWFTNSKISHTFLAIDLFGARLIIGAEAWGLDWRTKARFEKDNTIKLVVKPIALPVEPSFAWLIRTYAGAAYDWGSAGATGVKSKFRIIWKYIAGWFKKWPKEDALMCEEVSTKLLQHAGFNSVEKVDASTTSAEALMQIILKSPEFEVVWKAKGL
jgi:hypothetical protein